MLVPGGTSKAFRLNRTIKNKTKYSMKKITSLLLLVAGWLVAFNAQAQFTCPSAYTPMNSLTDGYYLWKTNCKGTEGFMYRSLGDTGRPFRQKPTANLTNGTMDSYYVWKLTKKDSCFTLQNLATGEYIPAHNGNGGNMTDDKSESNAALLYYEDKKSEYAGNSAAVLDEGMWLYETNYKVDDKKIYVHVNTSGEHNLSYWAGGEATNTSSVVQNSFYKVEVVEVTYNVKDNSDNVIKSYTTYAKPGSTATMASEDVSYYYTNPTFTETDFIITADNKTFNITYEKGELPFTASTDAAPVWCTMKFRSNDLKYMVPVNTTDESPAVASWSATSPTAEWSTFVNAIWSVEESGFGVKIKNRATGKYLTCSSSTAPATLTTTGTEFIVGTCSSGGFSLHYPGSVNNILGDHTGWNQSVGANTRVGIWVSESGKNDNGSSFSFQQVNMSTAASLYSTYLATLKDNYPHDSTLDPMLLQYEATDASVANAQSLTSSATTLDQLEAILPAGFTPEESAYYQIYCARNKNQYLTSATMKVNKSGSLDTSFESDGNRVIKRNNLSDALVPQLWKFERNDKNQYLIKNANVGCAVGYTSNNNTALEMPIKDLFAGHYYLQKGKSNTQVYFKENNGTGINALNGDNGENIGTYDGNSSADDGSNWYIKKVTEVPVTISSAQYGTLCLPFPVTIPTGVKAYKVTAIQNSTSLVLEEIAGIIPANTGVILAGEAGTYNFTITTSSEQAPTDNLLTGANARRGNYEEYAFYGLGNKAAGVGFYLNKITVMPANKACLEKSNLPTEGSSSATQMLSFRFADGTQTGINNATTDTNADKANTYYDLNGRRVLYPTNGIFVNAQGKKVFIR